MITPAFYRIVGLCLLLVGGIAFTYSPQTVLPSGARIVSNPSHKAISVYLTTTSKNEPVMVWSEEDPVSKKIKLFFSVSSDGGNSFSQINEIPVESTIKVHAEGMPKIIYNGKNEWYVFYESKSNTTSNRFAAHILYIISKDNGVTWSTPKTLHRNFHPDRSWSFYDVTRLSNGALTAVWLDTSYYAKGRVLKIATTGQDGTFQNERIIDSLVCPCCRTSISSAPNGTVAVVYRDIVQDSIRDIAYLLSKDEGRTFEKARAINDDGWILYGCPHNGPQVKVTDKSVSVVWFTGAAQSGVYIASFDSLYQKKYVQRLSTQGTHIQLSYVNDTDVVAVYDESYKQQGNYYTMIKAWWGLSNKSVNISSEKVQARLPVVVAVSSQSFIAAWLQEIEGHTHVVYRKVTVF